MSAMCGAGTAGSAFRLLLAAGLVLGPLGTATAPSAAAAAPPQPAEGALQQQQLAAACRELPQPGFPGKTAQDSATFWPSGRVPELLECWPKNSSGGLDGVCTELKELEDFAKDWPGQCSGLTKVSLPDDEASCEAYCKSRTDCAVFQVSTSQICWLGLQGFPGTDCYIGTDLILRDAKRLMHGSVRELASLEGVQIIGLQQGFDENYFINVYPDAVDACKHICYSNIFCRFWQYSLESGCWTEVGHPSGIEDPITRSSWRTGTSFAATVVAGQYIQRVCGTKTPTAEDSQPLVLLPGELVFTGNETVGDPSAPSAMMDYREAIADACGVPPESVRNMTEHPRSRGYRFVLSLPHDKDKEAVVERCSGEELPPLPGGGSGDSAGRLSLRGGGETPPPSTTLFFLGPSGPAATSTPPYAQPVVRRKIPWWGWAILLLVVAICMQSSFLGYFGIDREITMLKYVNADERSAMMASSMESHASWQEHAGPMGADTRAGGGGTAAPQRGSYTAAPQQSRW